MREYWGGNCVSVWLNWVVEYICYVTMNTLYKSVIMQVSHLSTCLIYEVCYTSCFLQMKMILTN